MSGTDIFIAILAFVMFFGGLYLNITSRKMVDQYNEAHKPEKIISKVTIQKPTKYRK